MKFSIIVPTYNRSQFVFRTLESLAAQTHRDFEIIVVDDGSTDDTESRFRAYHGECVLYARKENGERGAARNFGARLATGDYLNFFDSDDLALPTHLAEARRAVESFARPEVFGLGFQLETARGRVKQTITDLPDPLNDTLLSGNVLGCNPVFVRADVFAELNFDETRELAGTEDWLLWLRLCARYSFRYWNAVTSRLIDHEERSVRNFREDQLVARGRVLVERLRDDPRFMARYGRELKRIEAFRHVYTGLHLALSGGVRRPFVFLGRAALVSPQGLFRRATLGTLKHALRNAIVGCARTTRAASRRALRRPG